MKNPEVQIAKIEANKEVVKELVRLLTHPVLSIVAAFVIIEFLQAQEMNGKPLMGSVAGSSLEGGLIAGGVIQSLSQGGMLEELMPLLLGTK